MIIIIDLCNKKGVVEMKGSLKVFILLALFSRISLAKWNTPYHSINENDYKSVIATLGSPTNSDRTVARVANYAKYNFVYVTDAIKFGKNDYWQSSQEMFKNKSGDCEDWAAFIEAALKQNNIAAYSWFTSSRQLSYAHVIVIAPYKSKWAYLDSSPGVVLHDEFASKEAITNNFWEKFTGNTTDRGYIIKLPQNDNEPKLPKLFVSSSRLKMHQHLTELEGNWLELSMPLNSAEKDYSKLSNKEAVGFLAKTHFLKTKAMGFSYSEHGWYSPSRVFNDRMFTFHVLLPYVGVNAYTGDYQGVDIDVNPISLTYLKVYVAMRNFGEVWDYKTVLPFKYFEGQAEYNNKVLSYSFHVKIPDARAMSNLKLGWSSAKEFKMGVDSKEGELALVIGRDTKLSMGLRWGN